MGRIKPLIVKAIREEFKLPHYRIFLFGSRVGHKRPRSRSDYDIGVEAAEKIPLFSLHQARARLEELPILQKIDLVDFGRVSPEFKEVALQQIEILHEQ